MKHTQQKFVIGRDRTCDIAIAHDTVSAHHAELSFIGDGKLLLTDCKSRNGTYRLLADGREEPVRQHLISPLDRVRFGEVRILVRELLDALRVKFPQVDQIAPQSSSPVRQDLNRPQDLERCECGRIKPAGRACPGCGR